MFVLKAENIQYPSYCNFMIFILARMADGDVSPVLPLSERLARLRPSAELLQFYRNKVFLKQRIII